MNLELQSAGGGTIVLEKKYKLAVTGWRPRTGIKKRYSKHGGQPTGDEQVDAREITFKYGRGFQTDQDFRDWANTLVRFFRKENAPHYLADLDNLTRTRVRLTEISPTWGDGLEYRVIDATMKLSMLDAVWEDATETLDAWNGVTNGDTHLISLSNQFADCYPVFTITAINDNPEFTINNLTLGAGFTMAHNAFLAGSIMVLDFITGEFTLDGVLIPQSMTQGGPFFLRPGANTLEYLSVWADVDIQTGYRKTYGY